MNKFLILITGILFSTNLYAQDYIMLKDGNVLTVDVIKVDSSDITYKKTGTPGETASVLKKDVLAIYYRSGAKEDFNNSKDKALLNIDTITYRQGLFIRVSGCLDMQFITLYNLRNDNLSDPLKVFIYPVADVGYSLMPNLSVDLEVDYQRSNYNYSYSYTDVNNIPYFTQTVANSNTNLFLIPNLIIQANPNRFIPYGKIGAIAEVYNTTLTTTNLVTYNTNASPTGSEAATFTTTLPFHIGFLLAAGTDVLLSKHFYLFGELNFKGVFGKTVQSQFTSTGIISGGFGLNVGLKITF